MTYDEARRIVNQEWEEYLERINVDVKDLIFYQMFGKLPIRSLRHMAAEITLKEHEKHSSQLNSAMREVQAVLDELEPDNQTVRFKVERQDILRVHEEVHDWCLYVAQGMSMKRIRSRWGKEAVTIGTYGQFFVPENYYEVWFDKPSDALMFKLTWSGPGSLK